MTYRADHHRKPTVDIGPSALPEAAGGVAIEYGLLDGPVIFTLTDQEDGQLQAMIADTGPGARSLGACPP